MKSRTFKQFLKESTIKDDDIKIIKESSSFSKSKIIPLDKVKSFMDKARDKYDVDSRMEGNELIHAFYKKGTSNHVGTFVNSNRVYFYNDTDKIMESVISEATMSDIPHEIDDQIHKLKDMRFDLEETRRNWILAGLDTTPLANVLTGINELIHSMYSNGAKLADQEVVNESTGHDKEWEIWTLYRRYEDEVNNKWEKELITFDSKEEAEKYAKSSIYLGYHTQIVHRGDKPKKLKELKEDKESVFYEYGLVEVKSGNTVYIMERGFNSYTKVKKAAKFSMDKYRKENPDAPKVFAAIYRYTGDYENPTLFQTIDESCKNISLKESIYLKSKYTNEYYIKPKDSGSGWDTTLNKRDATVFDSEAEAEKEKEFRAKYSHLNKDAFVVVNE